MSLSWHLVLAGVLFAIGATTVLVRRSAIIFLMGTELILSSTNLVFVTFTRILGDVNGEIITFFVMIVAAAEVVVDLMIIVSIFKSRSTTSINNISLLRN